MLAPPTLNDPPKVVTLTLSAIVMFPWAFRKMLVLPLPAVIFALTAMSSAATNVSSLAAVLVVVMAVEMVMVPLLLLSL